MLYINLQQRTLSELDHRHHKRRLKITYSYFDVEGNLFAVLLCDWLLRECYTVFALYNDSLLKRINKPL